MPTMTNPAAAPFARYAAFARADSVYHAAEALRLLAHRLQGQKAQATGDAGWVSLGVELLAAIPATSVRIAPRSGLDGTVWSFYRTARTPEQAIEGLAMVAEALRARGWDDLAAAASTVGATEAAA